MTVRVTDSGLLIARESHGGALYFACNLFLVYSFIIYENYDIQKRIMFLFLFFAVVCLGFFFFLGGEVP